MPTLLDALRPTTTLSGPASFTTLDPMARALMLAWCLLCLAAASVVVRTVAWTELP